MAAGSRHLGGEDHRTTLHTTPHLCADSQAFDNVGIWGALSAWQIHGRAWWALSGGGERQIKAPTN